MSSFSTERVTKCHLFYGKGDICGTSVEKLKKYLREKKITLIELAERTHYSKAYLSRIVNGHVRARTKTLKLIEVALREQLKDEKNKWEKLCSQAFKKISEHQQMLEEFGEGLLNEDG